MHTKYVTTKQAKHYKRVISHRISSTFRHFMTTSTYNNIHTYFNIKLTYSVPTIFKPLKFTSQVQSPNNCHERPKYVGSVIRNTRQTYTSATMALYKVQLYEPSTQRSKEPRTIKYSTKQNNLQREILTHIISTCQHVLHLLKICPR